MNLIHKCSQGIHAFAPLGPPRCVYCGVYAFDQRQQNLLNSTAQQYCNNFDMYQAYQRQRFHSGYTDYRHAYEPNYETKVRVEKDITPPKEEPILLEHEPTLLEKE